MLGFPLNETIRFLTPMGALLIIIVWMARAWLRDRNSRIADLKQQVADKNIALMRSEDARDKDREISRLALEQAQATDQMFQALRLAAGQPPTRREDG